MVRDGRVELPSSVWKTDILTAIRIPRNRGDYSINDLNIVQDGDVSAETVEAFGQVFIAAVDGVDIAQHASAVGKPHHR
jgi:hypothetical protein